jgi:Tfp pilus assembly protein PilO
MTLSIEDRAQLQGYGALGAIIAAALIFAPGPDYGVPIGIYKLYNTIQRDRKLLETEKEKYEKEKIRIDKIPALENELKERGPEIQRYEARLPKSTNIPELFRDIDRFKQYAGLVIQVQKRIDPVDKGDYWELPISVEANGTYDSVAIFINQLERSQRFAQVKDLKISEKPGEGVSSGETQDFKKHNATMRISTFMFKDKLVSEQSKVKSAGEETAKPGEATKTK